MWPWVHKEVWTALTGPQTKGCPRTTGCPGLCRSACSSAKRHWPLPGAQKIHGNRNTSSAPEACGTFAVSENDNDNGTVIGWGLARGILHLRWLVHCHPRGDGITMAAPPTRAEHAAACDLPEDPLLCTRQQAYSSQIAMLSVLSGSVEKKVLAAAWRLIHVAPRFLSNKLCVCVCCLCRCFRVLR